MKNCNLEVQQASKMLAELKMAPSLTNEISHCAPEFNKWTVH